MMYPRCAMWIFKVSWFYTSMVSCFINTQKSWLMNYYITINTKKNTHTQAQTQKPHRWALEKWLEFNIFAVLHGISPLLCFVFTPFWGNPQKNVHVFWTVSLRKLTILVRMLTLFWTGPPIHEDPKENQLTIGRSTHRVIYTHTWGPGPGPGHVSTCACRSPDG